MANNATTWPKMIRAVYDSFDTGQHHNDAVARRVMDRIVSWLTAGKALSPRLQAKLIDNINMRTSFVAADPGAPIRLTGDQIKYAKKKNPEWFGLKLLDDLTGENEGNSGQTQGKDTTNSQGITLPLPDLSTTITLLFHHLSTTFPLEALTLAQRLVSHAAENCGSGTSRSLAPNPKVMEREEKECNHDMEVISASHSWHDHDRGEAAMIEEFIGQKLTHDQHELHAPQADVHVEQHEPAARQDMTERSGQGERATTTSRPTLTLWVKEDAKGTTHASGFLDVGEDKYALRFTRFDHQLERIRNGADADWVAGMNETIAPNVLYWERTNTGIASSATMSGLYARQDTWARKEPVRFNTALILEWRDGQPEAAHMIEGMEQTTIELRREANDRWKGSIAA